MRSAYVRPAQCSIGWTEPTPVSASPLLAELIGYLEDPALDGPRRANAEAVLVDILRPVAMTTIEVRLPADDRARQVADRIWLTPRTAGRSPSGAVRWEPASAPWPGHSLPTPA